MATVQYDIGDRRKLIAEVRDELGALVDPTTLTFYVKEPDKTVTVLVYGTDNEVIKDSVGLYHVYWDIAQDGVHWWRCEAAGNVGAAEEATFNVRKSNVLPYVTP